MTSRNSKIARLLGHLNPAAWDWIIPHSWDVHRVVEPDPNPWTVGRPGDNRIAQVALNPQPLPPKDLYALALADAVLSEVVQASRTGRMLGGEAGANMQKFAASLVTDFEDICPRWPSWPKHYRPPPPPPPWRGEKMEGSQLFFVATRLLLAVDLVEDERVRSVLEGAGNKLMDMGLEQTP